MPNAIGIVDLLEILGFDDAITTKMDRHQDNQGYEMVDLRRDGWFERYQCLQKRPRFDKCEQLVSFIGDGGSRARLYSVYKVLNTRPASEELVPANAPFKDEQYQYYYELEKLSAFDDLQDRVVIDWGPGAIAWVQKLTNKPVV